MGDVLEEAKRIANEAAQLAEQIETSQASSGTVTPAPTNYSSSVSSCTVDPDTGDVTVTLTLYPGDKPITPPPTPGEEPAPVVAPVVPAGEAEAQEPPPGFQPTQE